VKAEDIGDATFSVADFQSSKGVQFTSFAKNEHWDKDLYADLVQPHLQSSMFAETWRRSPYLPTYCGNASNSTYKYDTLNVEYMSFPTNTFHYTMDHSKFAIGTEEESAHVCVGGINRMPSQRHRGGGTVCFVNKLLWIAIRSAIGTVDSCEPLKPTPAPAPTPPTPSPTPSVSGCCYSKDDSCTQGDVCCRSGCKDPKYCSYTKDGCHSSFAQGHHCQWTGSTCVVGNSTIFQ